MGSEIKNRKAAGARHLSQCHPRLFRHESSYFPNVEVRTGKPLEIASSLFPLVDYDGVFKLAFVFSQTARRLWLILFFVLVLPRSHGQSQPSAAPDSTPFEETIVPTFETQKLAR